MRVVDEGSARAALKEINSDARKLMADFVNLQRKLGSLERFFRNDSERYKAFQNAHSVRVAGNELLRLARKLPHAVALLKQLEGFGFPMVFMDQEPEDTPPIKINKNATVPKITVTPEPEELELTLDE